MLGVKSGGCIKDFPMSDAVNNIVLHRDLINAVQRILGTQELDLCKVELWGKYAGLRDYEENMHRDLGNHTLVVPKAVIKFQQVTVWILLSDVTEADAPMKVIPLDYSAEIPLHVRYLTKRTAEWHPLCDREVAVTGKAGTLFMYRTDIFHRGSSFKDEGRSQFAIAADFARRSVGWEGQRAWPDNIAQNPKWPAFLAKCSIQQRDLFGFPPVDSTYWDDQTIADVGKLYPDMDMAPYRSKSGKNRQTCQSALETEAACRHCVARSGGGPTKISGNVSMFESFITSHWFSGEAKRLWSDEATLQAWLDVEAALALTQADLGMVPVEAAHVIAAKADASLFDLGLLAKGIAFAQHPLVPVLHQFEALCGEPAAGYIHLGATTQNIFDTAVAVQMRRTHVLLQRDVIATISSLTKLAKAHRDTPMAGRTHGQHALPMTFGFKVAGWIDELDRDRQRLQERVMSSFVASLGGAIGTCAALGPAGLQIQAGVASRLQLPGGGLAARASYDRVSDYVTALALLAGTTQKIAQDVVFLQRTEIGEVFEAFHMGKVGSSTMAQKRNPATALLLVSLARMLRARVPAVLEAMVRMDEGDSSATNVTDTLLPELAILAASMAQTLSRLAEGLEVDTGAMSRNLYLTRGLITAESAMMQLTPVMGRHEAHRLLYEAVQHSLDDGLPFAQAIVAHPALRGKTLPPGLEQALDPAGYVGQSATLTQIVIDRVESASAA
ncbi:Fumarate hydratase class II [Gonapodya sp. JEL0774]|nr:Fumarate hydratase class II [Gonapodya sp. JEL0774]